MINFNVGVLKDGILRRVINFPDHSTLRFLCALGAPAVWSVRRRY